MVSFDDIINNDTVRTVFGSIVLLGTLLCMVICLYKYALCQENLNKNKANSCENENDEFTRLR